METISYEEALKHNKGVKPYIKKRYPEFFQVVNALDGKTFSEKLYIYYFGSPDPCPCGNPTKFVSLAHGYNKFCSKGCASRFSREKVKQTCLERYGRTSGFDQDKVHQTLIKKYGARGYASKHIKDNAEQTCMERYGVKNASSLDSIKEKRSQTCMDRYHRLHGFDYEKSRATCQKLHGGIGYGSDEIRSKIIQTCIDRHGEEHFNNREKAKQTCLERYGSENPAQSQEVQEKMIQTNLERYGVKNIFESQEVQERIKQTNLERYGVEHPLQSKEIQEKTTQTCLERYGVPYGLLNKIPGYSKASQYLFDQLKEHFPNAIYATNGDEQRVGPYLLDWYDPDSNTVIEFNGDYWHANPKLYSPDWIHPIKKCTAKELWEHDREKKEYLEARDYKVIVIWESDIENEEMINNIIKEIV